MDEWLASLTPEARAIFCMSRSGCQSFSSLTNRWLADLKPGQVRHLIKKLTEMGLLTKQTVKMKYPSIAGQKTGTRYHLTEAGKKLVPIPPPWSIYRH